MVKLVEKNGQLGILITYVNKEGIKERKILSVKKIAVAIGLTVGIIAGIGGIKIINNQNKEEIQEEYLANLDENEKFIEEQLVNYNMALDEYTNVMKEANHNEHDEIEKRVQLISETRNLQTTANKLMEEKIREALGLESNENIISVERISNGNTGEPTDVIKVVNKDGQTVFFSDNIPTELSNILNVNEALNVYKGNGENTNWEEAINGFNKKGNELQTYIMELTNQEYTLEDGNIKTIEQGKSM